jgi:membrane-bound ClpP family serine protease
MVRTLSFGILGIVISSIFLALSLIAQEKPAVLRVPEKAFYRWQMLVFALALLMSAFTSIWIAARKREGLLLRKMIPEAATPDDQEEA